MNATEELRRLLDERGVEWWETVNHANCVFTWWDTPMFGSVWAMDNDDGYLHMSGLNHCDFTPEQAIAATLGSVDKGIPQGADGNLDQSQVEWLRYMPDGWDGTPPTLGNGECENVAPDYLDFLCSACGFVHYHNDENDTGDGNDWAFCPRCGKAVKR